MSQKDQPGDGAAGVVNPFAGSTDFSAMSFVVSQALASVRTATIVQVISCTNDGGLSPVGFVDVKVLVGRMDGAGNVIDAGVIYDVPYFRLQGGSNAIIIDPQPNDIGLACISDRDISSVKASRSAAAPGSVRRHDMADALYIGGILNGAPTQYIQFTADGITMSSPSKVTIQAPNVEITGTTNVTGPVTMTETLAVASNVTTPADVIAGGISLKTHVTTEVMPGGGMSGPPA